MTLFYIHLSYRCQCPAVLTLDADDTMNDMSAKWGYAMQWYQCALIVNHDGVGRPNPKSVMMPIIVLGWQCAPQAVLMLPYLLDEFVF